MYIQISKKKYNRLFLILFSVGLLYSPLNAQDLPIGYIKYYQQKCNSSKFITSLTMNDETKWKVNQSKAYTSVSPLPSDTSAKYLFPTSRGVISDLILGEYILEFEFKTVGQEQNDSAGFYLLSPVKSCDTYYAFGFGKDSLIFYYSNKGKLNRISSQKLTINTNEWTKVRIERDMLSRTMHFELKGNVVQSFSFTDRKLVMGYLGFGTQNVNSAIRNITLWAPTAITDKKLSCE